MSTFALQTTVAVKKSDILDVWRSSLPPSAKLEPVARNSADLGSDRIVVVHNCRIDGRLMHRLAGIAPKYVADLGGVRTKKEGHAGNWLLQITIHGFYGNKYLLIRNLFNFKNSDNLLVKLGFRTYHTYI